MQQTHEHTLITVIGPTGVGKTALAIKLACHFQTEVISADSRQVYREMSIGTAKPDELELKEALHHFIGSHSVTESFNVGDFEREGISLLADIFKRKPITVLVGGSGLFVKAICEGFDDLPPVDIAIREELNLRYQTEGIFYLQDLLKASDPEYYNEVDTHNPHRMIRALEVIESTGKPFSSFRTASVKQRNFNVIKIGLNLPREQLYHRINERVDTMIQKGLIGEVKSLVAYRHLNALNTVGYSELFDYLDGKTDLETATAMIKQNTRRFAKRQLTWFKKDDSIKWFEPGRYEEIITHINACLKPSPIN